MTAPSSGFDGRVALVTGGSRGIGRATALALAERGAQVVVCARDRSATSDLSGSLSDTVEEIEARGGRGLALRCDLADPDQVADLASAAAAWRGRLDIVVNNAAFLGTATFHSLDELTVANWHRQVAVNITAPLLLARLTVPVMRRDGGGTIVNVTSGAAEMYEGTVPGIAYGATKAALNRITLALARDLRADGIGVFAVDPGYVRTEVAEAAAGHPGWDIDIDTAHSPACAGAAIADLIQRPAHEVSGRFWVAVEGRPPQLRHDGRGEPPSARTDR